jgi:transposase-like protein
VTRNWPALFRGRHFEDEIILLCVQWYLQYSLSHRDLEEIMEERGLAVDHTIWRWVQRYAPILNQTNSPRTAAPESILARGRNLYPYRRQMDLPLPSRGFGSRDHRFLLSPKRDLIAAKFFLRACMRYRRHAAAGNQRRRTSSVCAGRSGDLGRRFRCRPSPYLNNITASLRSASQRA